MSENAKNAGQQGAKPEMVPGHNDTGDRVVKRPCGNCATLSACFAIR